MTACPLDGNLRKVVERDRYSVSYHCGWCGTWSREEYEPTAAGDLQREWGDA